MNNPFDSLLGKGKVQEQVDLFPYLSMRLHANAQYFFETQSTEDIIHGIHAAYSLQLPLTILGGGSNIVFTTAEVKGLVMKNNYTSIITISENDTYSDIEVGSGTNMAFLVQKLAEKGLSGLEYHKGLPGTVGGAVYMNSKWMHPLSYVGDCVISALLIDHEGKEKKVEKDYFAFDYDYSILQKTHEFIVNVVFRLYKKEARDLLQKANDSIEYRKKTQPVGVATSGCFFRNISEEEQKELALPTRSAGYLIDKSGMKGVQLGSFKVSEVHANFIINQGGDAKPEDLMRLVAEIKSKVKDKFGVILKEEVEIV